MQQACGSASPGDRWEEHVDYQTVLLAVISWESQAGLGDASREGRAGFGLTCGGWDREAHIEVAGKECSRGAAQRWECSVGPEGMVRCSSGFDGKQLAAIGVGIRSEGAADCSGGRVLQEPGLAAVRSATYTSVLFLHLISWCSSPSSKLGELGNRSRLCRQSSGASIFSATQQGSVRPLRPAPTSFSAARWRLLKVVNLAQTLALGCRLSPASSLNWAASWNPGTGKVVIPSPSGAALGPRSRLWLSACRLRCSSCFPPGSQDRTVPCSSLWNLCCLVPQPGATCGPLTLEI